MNPDNVYGLVAEFTTTEALLTAAGRTRAAGYRQVDAYTPLPIEGLAEALGFGHTRLPEAVLLGGILGGAVGYLMQFYLTAVDYPLNVGGRPLHSWPAFIPVTFEMAILGASLAAVLGMLWLNQLPMPYHPLFNVPEFGLASRDRFFLCIEAQDPKFDLMATRRFLESLNPTRISVVET